MVHAIPPSDTDGGGVRQGLRSASRTTHPSRVRSHIRGTGAISESLAVTRDVNAAMPVIRSGRGPSPKQIGLDAGH